MNPVVVHCPHCNEKYRFRPENIGTTGECTRCGKSFTAEPAKSKTSWSTSTKLAFVFLAAIAFYNLLNFVHMPGPIVFSFKSQPKGVEVSIQLDPTAERPLKTQLDGVLGDLKQHGVDFNSSDVKAISSTKYQVIGVVPSDAIQRVCDSKIIGVTNIVAQSTFFLGKAPTEFLCSVTALSRGFEVSAYRSSNGSCYGIW